MSLLCTAGIPPVSFSSLGVSLSFSSTWRWDGDGPEPRPVSQRAAILRYQAASSGDGGVWRGDASNGLMNLNDTTLVTGLSGWVLTSAEAVNDRGYIAGSGTYNGVATAFVLIPLNYP